MSQDEVGSRQTLTRLKFTLMCPLVISCLVFSTKLTSFLSVANLHKNWSLSEKFSYTVWESRTWNLPVYKETLWDTFDEIKKNISKSKGILIGIYPFESLRIWGIETLFLSLCYFECFIDKTPSKILDNIQVLIVQTEVNCNFYFCFLFFSEICPLNVRILILMRYAAAAFRIFALLQYEGIILLVEEILRHIFYWFIRHMICLAVKKEICTKGYMG